MALRALQGPTGGGAPVGGTGTTNTIPRWTGPSTLGDSGFVDDGSTIAAASRMLAIGTSSTTGARVWIQNNSSGNTLVIVSPSGAGSAFGQLIEAGTNASDYALNIRQRGTSNPLVYVRGDGNVGIGTTSPTYRLHLVGSSASTMRLQTPLGTAAYLDWFNVGNAQWGWGIPSNANAFVVTQNGAPGTGSEALRITDTGNVGIGTATPLSYANYVSLTIGGNDAAKTGILKFRSTYNGGNGAEIFQSTAGVLAISANGSRSIMSAQNTGATDSAAQVAIGTSSFTSGCSLTVTQSIDASQSAQGLKLPATPGNADTQTLDCYQEGTWVPTLAGFGGTNPTVTATLTRVGRLVTLTVQMQSTGGAQYSGTLGATTLTVPAGMTPNIPACTNLVNGAVQNLGNVAAYNDGLIYLPTFALTTAFTFFVVTYRV